MNQSINNNEEKEAKIKVNSEGANKTDKNGSDKKKKSKDLLMKQLSKYKKEIKRFI